ncbi:MAG: hypothetical protein M3R00_06825, partial [Pseudomonadota bacterium]|nr:hypothetical protein [Pseudomonadota bacterium]
MKMYKHNSQLLKSKDPTLNHSFHKDILSLANKSRHSSVMEQLKKWVSVHKTFSLSVIMASLFAVGTTNAYASKSCFVKFGGTGNGTSASKPYGSLQQVENNNSCKVIHVLPGTSPLDGGITLKDGQKLFGSVDDNAPQQDLPTISNTTNADILQAGPVIRLANNNSVKNLNLLALSIGILGDNITGANLKNLAITKAASYPNSALVDPELCDVTNAIYRGCYRDGIRELNSGIQLLADDLGRNRSFSYELKNILIQDIPDEQRWLEGILIVAAGDNTKINFEFDNVNVKDTSRGNRYYAYNKSTLNGKVVNSSAIGLNHDGLIAVTGFFKENCPQCPVSDPTIILNITGYTATPEQNNYEQGIEIVSFEPNKGTHEIHIENTSLNGFSAGFLVWNGFGYPKSAIYDLGCVNPNNSVIADQNA